MNPIINKSLSAITSERLLPVPLPSDISDQEQEIEAMFHALVRSDQNDSYKLKEQPHTTRRQEFAALIFIALVGLVSILLCYLFWLKVSGDYSGLTWALLESVK
jgi:hypothetical protein